MAAHETIVVLDFGAQTTQLIARRVRGLRVHSQVLPGETRVARVRDLAPKGLILSGGPASTYMARAPRFDPRLLELGVPVLGICYGMQLLAQHLGGSVEAATVREFGPATMGHEETALFAGLAAQETVWMNHGDAVRALPPGFTVIGRTEGCVHAAIQDPARQLYGLQFHPEVAHTPRGEQVLANFVLRLCGCRGDWTPENLAADLQQDIRERVGTERVLAAVSGGVDSTVLAVLLHRSLPGQVETLFVDSGLLRSGEADEVRQRYERLGIALRVVDAGDPSWRHWRGSKTPRRKGAASATPSSAPSRPPSASCRRSSSSPRARSTPTSSRAAFPAGTPPRSRRITTSAGSRRTCPSPSSSLYAISSRTRCAGSAPSSASRPESWGAIPSRGQGSQSASWDR